MPVARGTRVQEEAAGRSGTPQTRAPPVFARPSTLTGTPGVESARLTPPPPLLTLRVTESTPRAFLLSAGTEQSLDPPITQTQRLSLMVLGGVHQQHTSRTGVGPEGGSMFV